MLSSVLLSYKERNTILSIRLEECRDMVGVQRRKRPMFAWNTNPSQRKGLSPRRRRRWTGAGCKAACSLLSQAGPKENPSQGWSCTTPKRCRKYDGKHAKNYSKLRPE